MDSRLAGAPFALTNTIIYSIGRTHLSLSLSLSLSVSLSSLSMAKSWASLQTYKSERESLNVDESVCVRVFVCADVREREREGETGRPCRSPLTLSACPIPCTLYRRPALIRSKCILNFSLSLTQTHHCDDHCLLGLACTNKEYMYYLTRVISIEMLLTTYPVKVKMPARVFLVWSDCNWQNISLDQQYYYIHIVFRTQVLRTVFSPVIKLHSLPRDCHVPWNHLHKQVIKPIHE